MRIMLVGASGTIGRAVAKELGERHRIVTAGSRSGEIRMNITDAASIRAGFEKAGRVEAVV